MIDAIYNGGLGLVSAAWWTAAVWPVLWILLKIVCIVAPLAVLFPLTGASLVAALLIERAVWSLRQFAPSRSNPLH